MLTKTPVGLDEIIATFGHIEVASFEAVNIVSFELPYPLIYGGQTVAHARCHKLIVENFQKVFTDLKAAGLDGVVKNYGGIYARRQIRGQAAHASTHSWGIAGDFEPAEYPLGSTKKRFPDEVVQIFAAAGFFYGGDFKSRKDPMHFQFARAY